MEDILLMLVEGGLQVIGWLFVNFFDLGFMAWDVFWMAIECKQDEQIRKVKRRTLP
jgi:hypothetical protein